jgi:hypothetical protein
MISPYALLIARQRSRLIQSSDGTKDIDIAHACTVAGHRDRRRPARRFNRIRAFPPLEQSSDVFLSCLELFVRHNISSQTAQPNLKSERITLYVTYYQSLGWECVGPRKDFKITERFNFEFQTVIVNSLNHVVFLDPSGDYLDASAGPDRVGQLPGQGDTPRTREFGFRLNF